MKSKRVDAPLVPLAIALAAMLSIGVAVVWHQWLFWLVTVLLLICLGLYLNASWRGKEQIIDETSRTCICLLTRRCLISALIKERCW